MAVTGRKKGRDVRGQRATLALGRLGGALLTLLVLSGCRADVERPFGPAPDPAVRHPVVLTSPAPLLLSTGLVDLHGEPIALRCATCHGLRNRLYTPPLTSETTVFHLNVELAHGSLTCQSCHGNGSHDTFVLADGRAVAPERVEELCGQCHGPQYRDFQRGSHGGMTGYWDLSRGPRERNTCTACHAAHGPAYPQFMPVSGPRDRFLPGPAAHPVAAHQGDDVHGRTE
jgi:hypothetical protein